MQVLEGEDMIQKLAEELLDQEQLKTSIRLIGLSVSNRIDESEPMQLTIDF